MANTTTSLSIVKELRRLAQNPSHREYLLRNDINSILIFVDPDEYPVEVVSEAMHALYHLTEEASLRQASRSAMYNTVGLMDLMKKLEQREGYSVECKALAMKIQHLLNEVNLAKPASSRPADSLITRTTGTRNSKRAVKFLGENKKAKVITLQIDELTTQERRQQCIDVLVKVKGVISLTFNMHKQRCIIRARADLTPETLAEAVKTTEIMEASQVVKNEEGEEVLLSFKSKVDDTADQELPSYLEEEPVESPNQNDQAIARPNTNGLGSMASSWFGSVLNAVNKNLYW